MPNITASEKILMCSRDPALRVVVESGVIDGQNRTLLFGNSVIDGGSYSCHLTQRLLFSFFHADENS